MCLSREGGKRTDFVDGHAFAALKRTHMRALRPRPAECPTPLHFFFCRGSNAWSLAFADRTGALLADRNGLGEVPLLRAVRPPGAEHSALLLFCQVDCARVRQLCRAHSSSTTRPDTGRAGQWHVAAADQLPAPRLAATRGPGGRGGGNSSRSTAGSPSRTRSSTTTTTAT